MQNDVIKAAKLKRPERQSTVIEYIFQQYDHKKLNARLSQHISNHDKEP